MNKEQFEAKINGGGDYIPGYDDGEEKVKVRKDDPTVCESDGTAKSYKCQREEQCDDCWLVDHLKECNGCEHVDHPKLEANIF